MNIRPMTQYQVWFDKTPQAIGTLTHILCDAKIEFGSAITAAIGRKVSLQFLAHQDGRLRKRLESRGLQVREEQVFQLEMPKHPWEFYKLAKALADDGIQILTLHSRGEGESLRLVLAVDQPANAVEIASRLGFKPDYAVI